MTEQLEKQLIDALDDSVEHLDAATLSRLNQARQRAIYRAEKRSWLDILRSPTFVATALALVLLVNFWPSQAPPEETGADLAYSGLVDDMAFMDWAGDNNGNSLATEGLMDDALFMEWAAE